MTAIDMPETTVLTSGFHRSTPSGNLVVTSSVLVECPTGAYVIDPGAWNQRSALIQALGAKRVLPEEITGVIVTHLHWDHFINYEIFENADLIVPALEWQRIQSGQLDRATPRDTLSKLRQEARLRIATADDTLAAGLRYLETPGHTSGHHSVIVEAANGVLAIAGDAVSDRTAFRNGCPELAFDSWTRAMSSVNLIRAVGGAVLPGHDGLISRPEVEAMQEQSDGEVFDAVQLNNADNNATAVRELAPGMIALRGPDGRIVAVAVVEAIPYGHKFALQKIKAGEAVTKYGERIGHAKADIESGEHVHVQNVESERGRGDLAGAGEDGTRA